MEEYTNSISSKDIERSRQAFYIRFTKLKKLEDPCPCGEGPIWDRIFGHYVKQGATTWNQYSE
eukprot:scaffold2736_cov82-Skeletonema_dohrnii-CCMP3373.AAC.16